jgi:hypothetical protein
LVLITLNQIRQQILSIFTKVKHDGNLSTCLSILQNQWASSITGVIVNRALWWAKKYLANMVRIEPSSVLLGIIQI